MKELKQQFDAAVIAWKKCRNKTENNPEAVARATCAYTLAFDEWNEGKTGRLNAIARDVCSGARRNIYLVDLNTLTARQKSSFVKALTDIVTMLDNIANK